ncbi:type II toxin-antitoxin system RelE/ParE family toxin, partial [Pseudomonas sp. FSL R10-0071]|uniref:type II toxin-antitoxin system RelE/ParE family toxin n=1 Tax=Pseudomonas sp. FSL R10-0071 TaxID=2662193 RepID=UPI00135FC93B|nr:type II toxin-antitoxin system RelE/ParE family toxin [Pseudomonas sp. FSL R10-0071]
MTFKVVLLQSAQVDLKALRKYIAERFCASTWQVTYEQLKATIRLLAEQPHCGSV